MSSQEHPRDRSLTGFAKPCIGVAGMFFGVPVCACLYSLVAFLVDRRLAEKDLPVETEHYTAPLPEQETEPEKPEKTSENL